MTARGRYFALAGVRIAGALGAVLGVVLIARAHVLWPKILGAALVLSALYMTASVSGALAKAWRSAPAPGEVPLPRRRGLRRGVRR